MTQAKLPGARAALVDQNGLAAPAFYRFLAALETAQAGNVSPAEIAAIQAEIAAIQAEIDALPEGQGYPNLQVSAPLLSQGLLKNGFAKLLLDKPGDSGTGALKGVTLDAWGRVTGTTDATITGTAGRVTVANGDAAAGVPTIDLAAVIDTGGGSLLKFVRDAWGRITGTSTPTTVDLAEGSNLYFTVARVLATALAGLSTATNAAITAADSVLVALGKLQAQITANVTAIAGKLAKSANLSDVADAATARGNLGVVIPQGYIDGLQMVWNSGTSISVTSGTAYIPSLANVLASNSTLTLSGLSLTASTWYHVYLYSNAGVPAIECVTTAPVLYYGTSYQKTGDSSRRYVGSVLTDPSSNIWNFKHDGSRYSWMTNVANGAPPFRILSNGQALSATIINASAVMPVTAFTALLRGSDTDASIGIYLMAGDYTPTIDDGQIALKANLVGFFEIASDSLQRFKYRFTGATSPTGGLYVDLIAFNFLR